MPLKKWLVTVDESVIPICLSVSARTSSVRACLRVRALDAHDAVLDGEMNELSIAAKPVRLHHLVFVKFDRPRRNRQHRGDFLGRTALSQQLQDFTLAGGQQWAAIGRVPCLV